MEKGVERSLALLTKLVAFYVRKKRARRSWWSQSWSDRGTLSELDLERFKKKKRGGDFCHFLRGGKWMSRAPEKRKQVGGQSGAGSLRSSSEGQEKFRRRRSSWANSSEACSELRKVTGKRETWMVVKSKGVRGMRLEWEKTGRWCTEKVREWWSPRRLPELLSAAAVVPLLSGGSTDGVGQSKKKRPE